MTSARTRLLILGSLPGEASLAAARYYAHPQNEFWRLTGGAIGQDVAALDYPARLAALDAAGIGLWDVVGSARRAGSLDTAIREIAANPLADLVATLPQLRAVAFNGGTAARIGRRQLGRPVDLALIDLPSSSAAYCRIPFAQKQERWDELRIFLA
ncbi:DNA-deoxyinosine glycosylase [Novosphingobium lentum]|uniref:DNA-deoxyinosine glycosylase n=1 Tax=Novosphingobium lentum TaxID=145287 RepID=UPI0034E1EC84